MTLINTDTRGVRTHFLPPRHLTEPLDHYLHPSTLLSRKQLLFVEPDAETRELLHLFLGSLFHVVVVDTLEQGLECAGLNRPDLVAVSVAPDEEGNVSAFLDTIHTSYSGNEPAALAIVEGWQWTSRPSHLLDAGFNALLQRPFTMRGLYASMFKATKGNLGQLMLPSS